MPKLTCAPGKSRGPTAIAGGSASSCVAGGAAMNFSGCVAGGCVAGGCVAGGAVVSLAAVILVQALKRLGALSLAGVAAPSTRHLFWRGAAPSAPIATLANGTALERRLVAAPSAPVAPLP